MALKKLTTTSYAILGLLAVRPWTAYELTKQVSRSMGYFWPRAVSAIYAEPKNLVAHGLASAATEDDGERRRTRYRITEAGQAALEQWLALPSAIPQFESEAHVRANFAEHGTKEDLLRTLDQLGEWAEDLRGRTVTILSQNSQPDGPFPERAHLNAITGTFNLDYANLVASWARWARDEVSSWQGVGPETAERGREVIRAHLAAEAKRARA